MPAATSYGEGFVFRVYDQLRVVVVVVVCGGLEEEEVVVIHHAITGTIQSHRIIFMCVPAPCGCPKVFRRRFLISVASVQQGYAVCFWVSFHQIWSLPSLLLSLLQDVQQRYALYLLCRPGHRRIVCNRFDLVSVSKFRTRTAALMI